MDPTRRPPGSQNYQEKAERSDRKNPTSQNYQERGERSDRKSPPHTSTISNLFTSTTGSGWQVAPQGSSGWQVAPQGTPTGLPNPNPAVEKGWQVAPQGGPSVGSGWQVAPQGTPTGLPNPNPAVAKGWQVAPQGGTGLPNPNPAPMLKPAPAGQQPPVQVGVVVTSQSDGSTTVSIHPSRVSAPTPARPKQF